MEVVSSPGSGDRSHSQDLNAAVHRRYQRPRRQTGDESEIRAYLAQHRMFCSLEQATLADFATHVVARHFPRGRHLCYVGDAASSVYIVKLGLIALTDTDDDGTPRGVLTFASGDVFGATAATLGLPHTGTAVTIVDSDLYVIPRDAFDQLCRRHPELMRETLRELYEIACRAEETIVHLTMKQAAPRLAAFLLKCATETAGPAAEPFGFDLTLSHQDIALLLGIARETVTRTLTRFARAKLIVTHGRRMLILQPDALRQFATG